MAHKILHRLVHVGARIMRPLTLGVRALVVDGEGRIFLVRHSYVPGWHMPGGGVEPGETVLSALARELSEEGNILITGEPQLLGIYFNTAFSNRDHVAVFVVREFSVSGPRAANWEIVDSGFFAQDALPDGTTGATHRRIAQWRGGPAVEAW